MPTSDSDREPLRAAAKRGYHNYLAEHARLNLRRAQTTATIYREHAHKGQCLVCRDPVTGKSDGHVFFRDSDNAKCLACKDGTIECGVANCKEPACRAK